MQISNGYNYQDNAATRDAPWVRALFIGVATVFMIVMLVIPLMAVFYEAFKGVGSCIWRHWLSLKRCKRLS